MNKGKMVKKYDFFLAFPMSSISKEEYEVLREFAKGSVGSLHGGQRQVFCPAIDLEFENFDDPSHALDADLEALAQSKHLIVIFPKSVNSGVIFEAGYAFALGLPISIFVRSRNDLPFMLRKADANPKGKVKIHEYAKFDEVLKEMLALNTSPI